MYGSPMYASVDQHAFSIKCDGGNTGSFCASIENLSVILSQRISRRGSQEMWDFVLLLSELQNGMSVTRVLLCHPDWDEPMEIARIESRLDKLDVQIGGSSHAAT